MDYYFNKFLNVSFEEAIELLTESLKNEGFGVLTEIDVKKTLKQKLNVDFQNYKILGACNPQFAYKALHVESKIGTMLPCNAIVQEVSPGRVEIAIVDPIASMKGIENPKLSGIANQVQHKLKNVIENIKA